MNGGSDYGFLVTLQKARVVAKPRATPEQNRDNALNNSTRNRIVSKEMGQFGPLSFPEGNLGLGLMGAIRRQQAGLGILGP